MSYTCSQCSFTSQFESALTMHHQLHHDSNIDWDPKKLKITTEKSNTVPRSACQERPTSDRDNRGLKLGRTSSATRLLGKLRARICRSKTLFVHPEEVVDKLNNIDRATPSECSSKALKDTLTCSPDLNLRGNKELDLRDKESFACHLCSFDADRITVLDRHLLTDHKIGLENLLKLVMAKTKDGLTEDNTIPNIYGIRQPYYRPPDDIIEEGEFVIETVTPKIKILKHAGVNTDLKGSDISDFKLSYKNVDEDLDKFELNGDNDKRDLLAKMETLNECMCKFVDSSNMLKKVLTKEFDQKTSARSEKPNERAIFDLGLGDQESPRNWERPHSEKLERLRSKYGESSQESPRNWERPHSEKLERLRSKYGESRSGSEKMKLPSESFFF